MNQTWDKSHFRLVCERGVVDFQLQLATFVESREPDIQTLAPSFWIPGCGMRRICEHYMTQEQQLAITLEIRNPLRPSGPREGQTWTSGAAHRSSRAVSSSGRGAGGNTGEGGNTGQHRGNTGQHRGRGQHRATHGQGATRGAGASQH